LVTVNERGSPASPSKGASSGTETSPGADEDPSVDEAPDDDASDDDAPDEEEPDEEIPEDDAPDEETLPPLDPAASSPKAASATTVDLDDPHADSRSRPAIRDREAPRGKDDAMSG
jgi:hypothetical protein